MDSKTNHNMNLGVELSLVMPCLNEAQTLKTCIEKAKKAFSDHQLRAEIIVADNGSNDGSQQIALACGARLVHVETKGYGAALMGGFDAAKGQFIIMGDGDDSYDFTQIYPFVEKLREGYELVMGCRLPQGGGTIKPGAMPWHHRWIGNPILSLIGRFFFKSNITDFHCGLRAFKKESYQQLNLKTTGMEFASEMVIKAILNKLKITEIPITLHKDGRLRSPHLRSFRDGWRHLRFMLLFCPKWLFLFPGFVLYMFGLLFGAVLLAGPVSIGTIYFGLNSLLICAMFIVIGFNLITFSIFARFYSVMAGFLPKPNYFNKLIRYFNLERGLLFGMAIILIGLYLLIKGFLFWQANHFSYVSYPISLRLIVPSITAMTLGTQVIFSSFYLSFLGIPRKESWI